MNPAVVQALLPLALAFIMFYLGLTLVLADFRRVAQRPRLEPVASKVATTLFLLIVLATFCRVVATPAHPGPGHAAAQRLDFGRILPAGHAGPAAPRGPHCHRHRMWFAELGTGHFCLPAIVVLTRDECTECGLRAADESGGDCVCAGDAPAAQPAYFDRLGTQAAKEVGHAPIAACALCAQAT